MILRIMLCISLWSLAGISGVNGEEGKLATSPRDVQPILVGAEVPQVNLKDTAGESVNLRSTLQEKPTVLVFYRGHW